MGAIVEFNEKTFDDVSEFGDNTDRVNDIMSAPSIGQTSIVRYRVPEGKKAKINGISVSCDFESRLLSGAYTSAQDGAQIQIRFNSTVKFEQKFNWTGLNGYIGGADDYNAENEVMLSGYNMAIDAATVIDVYFTGKTNVRRMVYCEIFGTLDDGTLVQIAAKQAVDNTTATAISLYTVPVGRILYLHQIVVSTRHIDIYAGKGYLVYNGLPVMAFDVCQTEVGGVYGLFFPFYDLPLKDTTSIGIRMDSFECGNEVVTASVFSTEEDVGVTKFPIFSSPIIEG